MENDLAKVPFSADDEAKEESLNFLLALRIDECKSGDEPFYVAHEAPEQTKRKPPPAKSPHPDIAFVLYDSPRSLWPLEGKVLANEGDIGAYVKEVRTNLLTGRYATLSSEGGMLGYLLEGSPNVAFQWIEADMHCDLTDPPSFVERNHEISQHERENRSQPPGATRFYCHHLLLRIMS